MSKPDACVYAGLDCVGTETFGGLRLPVALLDVAQQLAHLSVLVPIVRVYRS